MAKIMFFDKFKYVISNFSVSLHQVSQNRWWEYRKIFLISDCSFCWSSKSIFDQDVIGFIGLRNIANWNVDGGVLASYCPRQNIAKCPHNWWDTLNIFRRPHGTPTLVTRLTPTAASRQQTRDTSPVKILYIFCFKIFFMLIFFRSRGGGLSPGWLQQTESIPARGALHPPATR